MQPQYVSICYRIDTQKETRKKQMLLFMKMHFIPRNWSSNFSPELDDINANAKAFTRAISYSIVCTQNCCNAADEVSTILKSLKESKNNSRKHRKRYVQHMRSVFRKGRDNAKKAEDEFRKISKILQRTKQVWIILSRPRTIDWHFISTFLGHTRLRKVPRSQVRVRSSVLWKC